MATAPTTTLVVPVYEQRDDLVGRTRTKIATIELDALTSESLRLPSQVTAYPVEDGTVISDHVLQEQEEIELTGRVTGSIVYEGDPGGGKTRLIDVRDALRKVHADRLPITAVTGIDAYTDVVMEDCDISRSNEDGFMNVRVRLRKIRRVSIRTADIPPEKVAPKAAGKAGKTKSNAGKANQQTEQMGPQDQRGRLKKAKDAAASMLGR